MSSNWLTFGLGVAMASALAFLLHTVDVDRLERDHASALLLQQSKDEKSCEIDKAITQEANNEMQKNAANTAVERGNAERLHPSTCIVVPTAQQANAGAAAAGRAKAHGTTTGAFRDYAADYKTCQNELNTVWGFVDKTWAKNGQ